MSRVYNQSNGKEFKVPEEFVRLSHFFASVGKTMMELTDKQREHFYLFECGEDKFSILQIVQEQNYWNAGYRIIKTNEYQMRIHPLEFDKFLEREQEEDDA